MKQKIEDEDVEKKMAWQAYVKHFGKERADRDEFNNRFFGAFLTREAYAEHYLTEVEKVTEKIIEYIDFDLYIRTIEISDVVFVDYKRLVYVFKK